MGQTFFLCFLGFLLLVISIKTWAYLRQKRVEKVARKLDINFDEVLELSGSLERILKQYVIVEKLQKNPTAPCLSPSQEKLYYDTSLMYAKRKLVYLEKTNFPDELKKKYLSVVEDQKALELKLLFENITEDLLEIQLKSQEYHSKIGFFKSYLKFFYHVDVKNIFEYQEGINYFTDKVFEELEDNLSVLETFLVLLENVETDFLEIKIK